MNFGSLRCDTPVKILEETLKDEDHVLDVNVLQDQWFHFRLTDAMARTFYGAAKSLKSDGTLMSLPGYDESYRNQIRPIFRSFIGASESDVPSVRQLLMVSSDPNTGFLLIHKDGSQFLMGEEAMDASTRADFDAQFADQRRRYYPGYTGRLLNAAIFECSPGNKTSAMDTLAQYTNQLTK